MSVRFDTVGQWCGEGEGHQCGYCNQPNTSISTGLYLVFTSTERYNRLIDRGWRRSGKYLYKPSMDKICCPQYTIKCDVEGFRISRSQRRVLKSFETFLSTSERGSVPGPRGRAPMEGNRHMTDRVTDHMTPLSNTRVSTMDAERVVEGAAAAADSTPSVAPLETLANGHPTYRTALQMAGSKKRRDFRRLRKLKKIAAKRNVEWETLDVRDFGPLPAPPSFRERIDAVLANPRFRLRLVKVGSKEFEETFADTHAVYARYQSTIHGDTPDKCNQSRFHNFLCNSPFQHREVENQGAYHQQYWLDGTLIAVGVLDILPRCLSSVYFYYDPSYEGLTLGTLSALFELHLASKLSRTALPSLRWYYMGFYIHSCRKMRYKGRFRPSYLLCPRGYTWWPLEQCLPQLDAAKYCEFDTERAGETPVTDTEMACQVVISPQDWQPMRYDIFQAIHRAEVGEELPDELTDAIRELYRLAGRENARLICLVSEE